MARASQERVYIFCTLRDLQVSLVPREEWGKNQLTDHLMYVPRSSAVLHSRFLVNTVTELKDSINSEGVKPGVPSG